MKHLSDSDHSFRGARFGRPAGRATIARVWRGWTSVSYADTYVHYLREMGLNDYRATPGNRGAWILRRDQAGRSEFVTLSLWDDMEAIERFAGEDPEQAVFHPEDDRFLAERETLVRHFQVFD